MSNQQHTPEPWISVGSSIGIPNGKGAFYMVPLFGINQDRREADARRIAACVNACVGMETFILESVVGDGDSIKHDLDDLTAQRDQLLAALVEARESLQFANDSPGGVAADTIWMIHRPETLFDFMDAAIASVKESK